MEEMKCIKDCNMCVGYGGGEKFECINTGEVFEDKDRVVCHLCAHNLNLINGLLHLVKKHNTKALDAFIGAYTKGKDRNGESS